MSARLISPSKVKAYVLEQAKKTRYHSFERVSGSVYDKVEAACRHECDKIVAAQPSKGKTIGV